MLRLFLISAAVLCGLAAAGFVFGWGFLTFDDFAWQRHWAGWLCLSVAAFAAAWHPLVDLADEHLSRLAARMRR